MWAERTRWFMEERREKSKMFRNGKLTGRRFIAFVMAFVMAVGMDVSGFIGKSEEASAAAATTVTVSEVTIEGEVGKKMEPQTIEMTVSDGTFDPVALYEGKDITDYFRLWDCWSGDGTRSVDYYFREDTWGDTYKDGLYRKYYYAPLGITISVIECTDTKLICEVSGTPISPSQNKINVYLSPEMFATRTSGIRFTDKNVPFSSTGKWNITTTETGSTSVTLTCDQKEIEGTAGQTELNTQFTLTLKKAMFALDLPAGTDVSVWFSGTSKQLPVDVTAILVSDVKKGDKTCTVKLSGIPRYGCYSALNPVIPAQYILRPKKDASVYWQNYPVTNTNTNVKFSITGLENEEPYMVANSANLYMYPKIYNKTADSTYNEVNAPRAYFYLYKGYLSGKASAISGTIKALENNWLYSNQKGNLDTTSAEGFLYSPGGAEGPEDHLIILGFNPADYYQNTGNTANETQLSSQKQFYLSIKGTPYSIGEYPLSFFVPKNLLIGQGEAEGYTTVVIDKIEEKQGKLVIMNPLQLEVDNALISGKKGDQVDTYITVKTSVYSNNLMKDSLTIETLKYTVSDEFKALGLNLEPVKVTPRSVVFHMTGYIAVKEAVFNLENAVTFSYENFNNGVERYGEIKINPNPDAVIKISQGKGAYGKAGQEIDYTEREDVIIYAKNASGTKVETTYINMTKETFTTDMDYKAYSVDGGTKWKKVDAKLTDEQFAKLLSKGMTFAIADELDAKGKKPSDKATILTFSKTEKPDAAPKFKVDYVTWEDPSGATTGQFILTKADGTVYTAAELRETYEIGIASGKTVDENGYGIWPTKGGLTIGGLENGKTPKNLYYIRIPATETKPASKAAKVSVTGQQKAPKEKADYKKESIKLKKGEILYFGEEISGSLTELSENAATYEDYAGKIVKGGDSGKVVDISAYITDTRNTVLIWTAANAKKPASAIQTIKLAARAPIAAETITCAKGKMTLDKKYEVYDPAKGKWGGAPKVTESGEYKIRLKMTVKAGKENDTTYAAGLEGTLKITYGEWDTAKHKNGITAASIVIGSGTDSGSGENSGSGADSGSGSGSGDQT